MSQECLAIHPDESQRELEELELAARMERIGRNILVLSGKGAWAIVVTTPQDVAIADVRRSVSFCKTLRLRVAGIIENMKGLIWPHCGQRGDIFNVGGGEKLAKEMNVPFLGRIPLDPRIVASGDSGRPFVESVADSPAARAFAAAVEPILNHTK